MDPRPQCCHHQDCWADGRVGEGHIAIHRLQERRYRGERCGKTVVATKGRALYRAHQPPDEVAQVVTLLTPGCPPQAIVAAFDWDERTVARYQREAGAPCRRVHEHVIEAGQVDLGQVPADELRVRLVGGVVWLATALTVTSRSGYPRAGRGGVVSTHRDRHLIHALLRRVRACGPTQRVLWCVDGLSSDVSQARRVCRETVRTGQPGRPRLVLPQGVLLAQAVKRYAKRRVVGVTPRVVRGTAAAVQARLIATPGMADAVSNTASSARLNATCRAHLAVLVRRTRAAARQPATLAAGRWLVGTCSNCWWAQASLRRRRGATAPPGGKWVARTPAQAAGLTDHQWSVHELVTFPVPPPPLKRRGRRPHWLRELAQAA